MPGRKRMLKNTGRKGRDVSFMKNQSRFEKLFVIELRYKIEDRSGGRIGGIK